ncbi:MAG TPA: dihydrofolate reductase [Amphiplicatus sp.]|nr:dihydrofolate reductase [Amphiplicatus sp.]MCB9954583.1 dihydrofolate reductase [Caulobacterales bacterium]HOP19786.1 dihydrofolate reductase [Amphiplicatus sp.]
MTRLALVVAVSRNGVIGDQGRLPWRISDDLKWFKKVTLGKPVVMGRKTFESIGKALPGRANIVVTRSADWSAEGAIRAGGVEEALAIGVQLAEAAGADEICVIGGGEIYAQTVARADRIYLTRVDVRLDGAVRFPDLAEEDWRRTSDGGCEKSEKNEYSCEFFILDRAHRPE